MNKRSGRFELAKAIVTVVISAVSLGFAIVGIIVAVRNLTQN